MFNYKVKYLIFLALLSFAAIVLTGCSGEEKRMLDQLKERVGAGRLQGIQLAEVLEIKDREGNQIVLNDKQKQKLMELVLNDDSYSFDCRKRCLFIPEYELTYPHSRSNSIQFSPSGNQIRFINEGKKVTLDYDPVKEEFETFFNTVANGE